MPPATESTLVEAIAERLTIGWRVVASLVFLAWVGLIPLGIALWYTAPNTYKRGLVAMMMLGGLAWILLGMIVTDWMECVRARVRERVCCRQMEQAAAAVAPV
jgi:ABC-type microcin C transport system permease subunit YejE